ncbi:hypothetical protein KSP39_PZI020244 [Platanthera zijinensis]|uniref:RIN4 pathogenic type III effector avirulence factor Avr cleavage site domain-containing protein n=1 Tax=Platanthera zijinensis TaxID=2320716 RepID=A0AAP0FWR1_9ASPA
MEKSSEMARAEWLSVPAFGEWEKQHGMPDYSLDFSKIREMRKQNKSDYSRISVGNDDELLHQPKAASAESLGGHAVPAAIRRQHTPPGRKKFRSYFVCCIGA